MADTTSNELSWEQIDLTPTPETVVNVKLFLDKSGSMRQDWSKTIDGVVEYFTGLKGQSEIKYSSSLYAFADKVKTVFENLPLAQVDIEQIKQIQADGVSTALFDAICAKLKAGREDQANLVVVFTDGEDNSSRESKAVDVRQRISTLEAAGNHTFVFMGAGPDVWPDQADIIAIPQGNRSMFARSNISESFSKLGSATRSFSMNVNSGGSLSTESFYAEPAISLDVKTATADDATFKAMVDQAINDSI